MTLAFERPGIAAQGRSLRQLMFATGH